MRRRVRGILMSGKQFSLDSHMDIVVHTCLDSATTPSTAVTTFDSHHPIREDNEDGWEAYESLGTPPRTPPPMISPLILTPSNSYNKLSSTSPTLQNIASKTSPGHYDAVRAPTRRPPNTLTLPTRNSYIIDNTVFMHNLETSMSFTRCYDSPTQTGHQCASPLMSPGFIFPKTHSSSSICSPTAAGRSGSNRRYGRQNSIRTQLKQEEEVYHGKRYLDPVVEVVDGCAFVNDGFRAISVTTRQEFRSNIFGCTLLPEIAELQSPTAVDWEAVRSNFRTERARLRRGSNSFPKFRIRINDEHGNRIKSSFESPSGGESSAAVTPESHMRGLLTEECVSLDNLAPEQEQPKRALSPDNGNENTIPGEGLTPDKEPQPSWPMKTDEDTVSSGNVTPDKDETTKWSSLDSGEKTGSTFDSSSGAESSSSITPETVTPDLVAQDNITAIETVPLETLEAPPKWSSSDRSETSDSTVVSNDGWTTGSSDNDAETKKLCQKCGHTATCRESSSSSS